MTDLTPAEKAVFGHDAQRAPDGSIIEQGFGAIAKKSAKVIALEKDAEAAAKVALAKLTERAKLEAGKIETAVKTEIEKIDAEF